MKSIDLHTHSTYSDGSMTPAELVACAKKANLSAIAVSDHDTTAGVMLAIAAGKEQGIEVVPAIELSAASDTETHILGYFIDPAHPVLQQALEEIRDVRVRRTAECCEKLRAIGIDVSMEEVYEMAAGNIVCRAHIARILTHKGYVNSPKEAFTRYLSAGGPAYSATQAITDTDAIRLIRQAGGQPYLAHLHLTQKRGDALRQFVHHLAENGLAGIEGYYTDYTPAMETEYRALAQEYGLAISGGTDFHGAFKPHIQIGRGLGNLEIPYTVLENMRLKAAM